MTKNNLSQAKRALFEKWLQGHLNDDATSIPPRPQNSPMALSFPQQRQLFLELLERGTAVNNLPFLLEFNGNMDIYALEQSANHIIARHDVLRTRFSFGEGLPVPEVLADLTIGIPLVDLRKFEDTRQLSEARRLAAEEVLLPFDLTHAPLLRLKLHLLSDDKYLFLVIVHHSVADGWSLGVFLQELMAFYQGITTGKFPQLSELPIQYYDFSHWQTDQARGEGMQSSMRYWKKKLVGELSVLELPTDQPRGARQTFCGGTHRFVLSTALTEALETLRRKEDATLFMTLLAAFNMLLHRYSGQDEILVGTPVANRTVPEVENLIGVFINTVVHRISLCGDPGFRALLNQVREISLEAFAHQDLPFEKLVEGLKPKRDLSRTPLFQVAFNLQNSPVPRLEIPGLKIDSLEIDRGVSQFDLSLMMSSSEGRCCGTVEYNRDLFSPAAIERMFGSFQMLLEDAIAQPDCAISRLKMVSENEMHQLVDGLNRTQMNFPREKCVHELFEAQVGEIPDAVALIHDHASISYLELNRRANGLARHLQSLGVGVGTRVGIFMERSPEMVSALLGVLKAGGTYVPIHASFPTERVQFILGDANVQVLLTNLDSLPKGAHKVRVVSLRDNLSLKDDRSNFRTRVTSDDPAYIIYTSGSTGRPKGVMVHHSALVNFLWSVRSRPGISRNDALLSMTSISFDIAALELFLPLIVGATLVVAGKEMTTNPALMSEAINRHHISVMQATPGTWQLLLDAGWRGKPDLKALCGGEILTRKLADQLLDRVGSLWNMYGPTETTVWSSVSKIEKGNLPITIGQPVGNTQLYILDHNLRPLPIGVVGELHIGGEGVARGYINQTDLTNLKFIPDILSVKPGARLYKTGDRARYLADGSIDILGRSDGQVKVYGHRIELGEIEAVLMQHHSVREAIAIARTETSGDTRLVLYFVSRRDPPPDSGELREFMGKKLPPYMIPAFFVRMDSFPLTPNGKTDRKSLPVPEDIRPRSGYVAPRTEDEQMLAKIWENALGLEQVGIHDNFFDLGGASIQSIEVVAKANMYGFRLSVQNVFEHQTIAELAAATRSRPRTL